MLASRRENIVWEVPAPDRKNSQTKPKARNETEANTTANTVIPGDEGCKNGERNHPPSGFPGVFRHETDFLDTEKVAQNVVVEMTLRWQSLPKNLFQRRYL
jgi:hypothetical protein